MRDDPTVVDLVTRARDGEKSAWDELVERYAPLVFSVCRRYRLAPPDIDDVGQSVWLRLVEHLPGLREPAALPGWIATTYPEADLITLEAADGTMRFLTAYYPFRAVWAGRSLVVGTVDEQILIFEHVADKLDRAR